MKAWMHGRTTWRSVAFAASMGIPPLNFMVVSTVGSVRGESVGQVGG